MSLPLPLMALATVRERGQFYPPTDQYLLGLIQAETA